MLFGLLKSREMEEIGKGIADRFAKRFPAALQDDPRAEQKRDAAMSAVFSELAQLRKRTKLGVLRKATLANTLKWELKERGYRPDVVSKVVYDILFYLAGKKGG